MSWDISIVTDTGRNRCADIEEVRNFTYNNSAILSSLGLHPEGKEEMKCKDWARIIGGVLAGLPLRIEELEKLEPDNKWGGIDDTVDMLLKLYGSCIKHPNAKVSWR